MQKVPDINLIAHEEEFVCGVCEEEVETLFGPDPVNDGKYRCATCMAAIRPDFSDAVADVSEIVDLILKMQSRMMSLDSMYELYGNPEEEPEDT